MKDIAIAISGMSCSHCLNAVNRAVATVPGVTVRSVRIGRAELQVPEDGDILTPLKAALADAGYHFVGIIAP